MRQYSLDGGSVEREREVHGSIILSPPTRKLLIVSLILVSSALSAPREGHGIQEYYHQKDRMQRIYDWVTRYTSGAGASRTTAQQ